MEITLKQARLLKGLKQKEVAETLGVHVQTYRRMENHPELMSIRDAKKICELLNVSCNHIFFNYNSTLSREGEQSHLLKVGMQ